MKKKVCYYVSFFWIALLLSATFYACSPNQDLYDPDSTTTKNESSVFDFSTSQTVTLNVDYAFKGYQVLFQVFKDYPLNEDGSRNSISPIYEAYTNSNCAYTGKMRIQSSVDSVWIYSDYLGVPKIVRSAVSSGAVTYKNEVSTSRVASSRADESIAIGNNYSQINKSYNLYALYDNYNAKDYFVLFGLYIGPTFWYPSNSGVSNLYSGVSTTNDSYLGGLLSRVKAMLQKPDGSKQNNSQYIRDNVHVNSTTIKDVHLDLVFLAATGLYHNAMAYYYYPSDKTLSASEIKALPKYVVFPRTTSGIPANQVKVRLQFFGAGYDQAGTDVFPKGYTIGWMLIPGVYDIGNTNYGDNINQVNSKIIKAYKNNGGIYSNHEANTDALNGCITLYDATSQKVVIGFEDTTYKGNTEKGNDQSFDDILFYVDADPISAIYDPDQPTIPDEKAETPDVTDDTRYGTLAYEDIWPKGGDYDLNDVVIEYQTSVTFNGDNVKKIVDTYKVVSKAGAATKADAFGFVINDNYGGTVTSDAPEFTKEESNQFILFSDARKEIGKTFTVTRTFYEGSYPSYASYQRDYNPFIVSAYTAGMKDRTEIHLPKSAATSWASAETGGENAFYVDKTGVYPFSIDIYQVVGLEQVTEMKMIGSEGEYPLFKGWAQSKGVENTDWYLYKNGK